MQVTTTTYLCPRFDIRPSGRKSPLPGPVDIAVRQRPSQRTGKCRSAKSASKVPVKLLANSSEVLPKGGNAADRQRNAAILATLAATHEDLPSAEVDVLHSQGETFREAKAASIQKRRAQARNAAQSRQHSSDLGFREYDGESSAILRAIDTRRMADRLPEHVSIQKE